jgi:hypothetical protein
MGIAAGFRRCSLCDNFPGVRPGDGVIIVFVVGEVAGVVGVGDVEFAQESGDVESVLVPFCGNLRGHERFGR